MSEKLFNLSDQNYIVLRIFQICGFLPFRLKSKDGSLVAFPFAIYIIFLLIVGTLKYTNMTFDSTSKVQVMYLSVMVWDICFLLYSWIRSRYSRENCKAVLKMMAEIDEIIVDSLNGEAHLKKQSARSQRVLTFTFIVSCLMSLYHPIVSFEKTEEFFDCLIKLFLYILIQMRITQIMFFYQTIVEKLTILNLSLEEIIKYYHIDRSLFDDAKVVEMDVLGDRTITLIRDSSLDQMKNKKIIKKIIMFRGIFEKCWLIQEKVQQFSSFNVLLYFGTYITELLIIQEKIFPDYLNDRNEVNLFDIIVTFFAASLVIYVLFDISKRLNDMCHEIGGKIHTVCQLSPYDGNLEKSVQTFSSQISQQQIREISMIVFRFDTALVNVLLIGFVGISLQIQKKDNSIEQMQRSTPDD